MIHFNYLRTILKGDLQSIEDACREDPAIFADVVAFLAAQISSEEQSRILNDLEDTEVLQFRMELKYEQG